MSKTPVNVTLSPASELPGTYAKNRMDAYRSNPSVSHAMSWETFKRVYPRLATLDHKTVYVPTYRGDKTEVEVLEFRTRTDAKQYLKEEIAPLTCGMWINLKKSGTRIVVVETSL